MNDQSTNPLPSEWVDRLFQKLTGRFGKQFVEKFSCCDEAGFDGGIANAKYEWGEMLAGLSGDDLKRGLMSEYKFPPSCDEFKIACRPSGNIDGRPTALEAWTMLPKRETHTRLVTQEMDAAAEGLQEMIESNFSSDQATAKAMFVERYESLVAIARQGHKKAVWRVSEGMDNPRDAIAKGLKLGVLSVDYCRTAFSTKMEEVDAALVIADMGHLRLMPPTETPEQREVSKTKALEAKNAIMKMLINKNMDETK